MQIPSLLDIQQCAQQNVATDWPLRKGVVLQNIMLQSLMPYWQYHAGKDQGRVELEFGGYDTILQDAMTGTMLTDPELDFVVVALWLPDFSQLLYDDFAQADVDAIAAEVERIEQYYQTVINQCRQHTAMPILLFNFTLPSVPALGIYDGVNATSQFATIQRLNQRLAEFAHQQAAVFVVDVAQCIYRVGYRQAIDWKYWRLAKMPFAHPLQFELANELNKYLRALTAQVRKCLVLDCDNVLWQGVLGEVGIDKIKPDRLLQQAILTLFQRGVLLALCSKNNEADVLECLAKNSNMLLRQEHFVALQINWRDKAENITAIAQQLNIGLDSVVFMDDNAFEIELVNGLLPQVTTLQANVNQPDMNHQLLVNSGYFDKLDYTREDGQRSALYQAEQQRQQHAQTFQSIDDYLLLLGMQLTLQPLSNDNIARAAQLTQRTNQFNLTTQRYSVAELEPLLDSTAHDVVLLSLADKFGDYGQCGLAVLRYQGDVAQLDVFLLSCRVLGRQVENAFLQQCIVLAARRGMQTLIGHFIPSQKNQQCAEFFPRHGFAAQEDGIFTLALSQYQAEPIVCISINNEYTVEEAS